jgi:2,3-dihydroxybiphenyl 1,2-dioxygenase
VPDIRGLGYLDVQTADLDRWRTFALDGIGWAAGSGPAPDALNLRMDERRARLIIRAGEVDRVRAVGWEVRDGFALERVQAAVEGAGVKVRALSEAEADTRAAEAVLAFEDPAGTPVEVFWGPVLDHSPVVTPFGGRFVTGAQGLGHVVLPTTAFAETEEFYTQVLGFLPRGSIRMGGGARRYVRFMGVNQRHHSLAIVPAPHGEAPGLVHLMVEVDTLDAVGQALDRVGKLGFSISSTLGRHTNDKMVSFYVRAPGGWDIELGWDGMRVDETYYTAEQITADSYWGHDWSGTEPLAAFLPPGR